MANTPSTKRHWVWLSLDKREEASSQEIEDLARKSSRSVSQVLKMLALIALENPKTRARLGVVK